MDLGQAESKIYKFSISAKGFASSGEHGKTSDSNAKIKNKK